MSSIPQFSAPQDLPNTIISYERLRNFTLLRKFKSVDAICILASARLINVKDTAVVVTIEDTVYQFGEDCDGLLYFTEIQSLSARRLKDVVFGRESTWFGISDDGKAYVWGGGSHLAPTHILQNLKIIQVDAMGHQIICLTSNGQVWISRDPLTEFLRIPQENFCGESIASVTSVTCGSSITGVALSAKGVIFAWDQALDVPPSPVAASLKPKNSASFVKIAGAFSCSTDGEIFGLFRDDHGKSFSLAPIETPPNMKPILNFAVDPIQEQFSKSPRVIQSSNGTVFVCSNYQLKVMKPDRSFQTTVEDAYVEFYGWKESCGTISSQWDMSKYLQYTNSEGVRLNDKETCDVTFILADGTVHAHKEILRRRLVYFDKMFSKNWAEDGQREIHIQGVTFASFYALLYHCYTYKIEMPTYDWESPADLARTAIFYCDELLKIKLEAVLLNEISFTNVLELLDLAITLNYEIVGRHCVKFILKNKPQILESASKRDFENIGIGTLRFRMEE